MNIIFRTFAFMTRLKLIAAGLLALISTSLFASDPVIRLGIVADIQYDPVTVEDQATITHRQIRHFTEGVSRLSEAVSTFNSISDLQRNS